MIDRQTSLFSTRAGGLAVGAMLAAAVVPADAAEISVRRDIAAPAAAGDLCEPARWSGKAAAVISIADQRDVGWWVVLATVPEGENAFAIVQDLEKCGLHPFNDFSGKFDGFRPGFQVVVDGAYPSRGEAERVKNIAARCVPDAYVKWARYLGE